MAKINNTLSNTLLSGTSGNDSIQNGGSWDGTWYDGGSNVTINTGDGNDEVDNWVSSVTINTGDGNDSVWNGGDSVTINTGDGNDSVRNSYGDSVTISGGKGNDSIYNNCFRQDDGSIYYWDDDSGSNVVFKYEEGDGNDIIYGFKKNSTLSIAGSYSSMTSGSDIIFTVGDGKITLVDAASLSKVNVKGTNAPAETNSWKLNGTTATYGTSSKTLVTVKGVNSTAGLSIEGKVVTVAQAALNNSNVTVSNGYTLALADDVIKKATTSTDWSYKDSVATYAQTTSAYYTLAGNKKSITYKKATSKNLVKIKGVKSAEGITINGKVITVPNKIIKKNVTVNGKGYEFKFAAGNTAITGSSNADKITNSGAKVSITGGKGNDIISLSSAAKNNVISYSNGDGKDIIYGFDSNDKLKIAGTAKVTTSGNDVVFTVGKGKITVKNAKNKTFSYSDAGGTKTYSTVAPSPDDGEDYTVKGKGITLSSSYAKDIFNVTEIDGGDALVTIDASAVTQKIRVKGNELANKIIGSNAGGTLDGGKGKVSDTLKGGNGADIFVYYDGDGNDVISGYKENDTIKIEEGTVDITSSREDVIFNVGDGKLTVQDVKGTRITYIEDDIEYGCLNGKKTLTIAKKTNGTIATLSKSYWKDTFDATKLGNEDVGKAITKIDAYAVTRTLKITGNDRANEILGSKTKSNTITGGGGDDTLQGGSGADVFIYTAGDGDDIIYGYDESDKISITSGKVTNVSVNSNNEIILTVGAGRIILDNAAGKKLTYYDDEYRNTPFSEKVSNNALFIADDTDYEVTPNLSSIVQNKAVDYSFVSTSTELTKETNLIAYAKEK
jgi:hypothetical protein